MIVKTQNKGQSIAGLRVGISNVRRYFRLGLKAIDLELDHLRIPCDLQASFWRDCPEISDPRLCAWLQSKLSREERFRASMILEMKDTGDCYRLTLPCPRRQGLRPD
jgi:hypothetical protein